MRFGGKATFGSRTARAVPRERADVPPVCKAVSARVSTASCPPLSSMTRAIGDAIVTARRTAVDVDIVEERSGKGELERA